MNAADIADFIDDTADYIEAHGWIRHAAWDDEGHVCIAGGMSKVSDQRCRNLAVGGAERMRERQFLVTVDLAVQKFLARKFNAVSIPQWNDCRAKDQQEVLDNLRECAKELRR